MRHRAHEVAEHLETIVDEVSHPKLPTDDCLFVALTAEKHLTARDTSRAEKGVPLKPLQQYRLSRFVTPRQEPYVLSEPLLDELCDRLQSPVNRRRLRIAVVSHGLRLVILTHAVDE